MNGANNHFDSLCQPLCIHLQRLIHIVPEMLQICLATRAFFRRDNQNRNQYPLQTTFLKILQVNSIVPHLHKRLTRELPFSSLILQHKNDTIDNGYHIYAPTHSGDVVLEVHTSPSFIRCQYFAHRLNLLHPRLRCLVVNVVLRSQSQFSHYLVSVTRQKVSNGVRVIISLCCHSSFLYYRYF